MSASTALRNATVADHQALEDTPFAKSRVGGTVDLVAYVDYLRAVAVVLANLRTAILHHGTPHQRKMVDTLAA